MKFFAPPLLLCLIGLPAFADDNIANCEIVVQKEIKWEKEAETGAEKIPLIAEFLPAFDFIFSVFDDEPGHLTMVDGRPIKALMCTRTHLVPTRFDELLIKTGIPFYVSPNFDAPDSALMAISKVDDVYVHDYLGPPLSAEDADILTARLEALNDH